ncbi:MAG: CapA family protein [Clostridia bacterium]
MKRWISALTALALTLLLGIGAQAESPADARYRALMKLEQLAQTVYPSAIKVMPARATLLNLRGKPGSVHLRVSTKPTLGRLTDQTITWTSEDPGIATVSKDGLVTGVAPGAVRIFAQIQGKAGPIQAACRVTVKEKPVATVTLSERDLVLLDPTQAGERTHQLSVKVLPHDATRHVIDWQTSDAAVATVNSEGLVTAVRAGVATITATVIGTTKADSVEVRVRDKSRMTPITISAGGDIVLGGDPLRKSDKRFEQLISQSGAPDYGYVLKNLVRLFSKDDITILNLEGPLKGGKPRDGGRKYNFYGKPEYANILTAGSVEVANIANNHINDFGTKSATKSILRKAGITLSDTSFDTSNCTMTVRGVTVGFLGFQTPASPSTIRNRVRQIKQNCDVVIVSMHFCDVPEHTQSVRNSQITQARAAIQGGAALVLGHHPHVISGIERYMGKYIYYDLGGIESSGPLFKYDNMVVQQELLVDLENDYVEPQVPTIYAGRASSAPRELPNNCQPMLYQPGDEGYSAVFSAIDRYSARPGLNPAPYKKGNP